VEEVLRGKINDRMFFFILVEDQDKGGVGVYEPIARDIASKMRKIVYQSADIARLRNLKQRGVVISAKDEHVEKIKRYLLAEFNLKVSTEQADILGAAVAQRVLGYTKKEEFKDALEKPLSECGVGFDKSTAHSVAMYLEKLLAQGVVHIGGGGE
jgi:hypothetical protein